MLPPDTNVFFSIGKSRPDVWGFGLRANNFSGIKSELSIVSIVKLYKVTLLIFNIYNILYSCKQGRRNGGGTGGTKSALFCDEKCPFCTS